ncbi:restriction endonuclease subunit S [Robiginitalea sediminis]|uniref:restriction endonuclease subunit S n=1 Tax=Robiginitalea sediminis TaxID=1982593 RepID=UPI000B4B4671|nr:restriction endonuclease subunit S [Robiginitalea sediminis]
MSKEMKLIPELRFPEFEKFGSWQNVNLEDVADVIKGKQLNRLQLSESGTYPCLNGGITPSGFTDKFNTGANTITISEGGNSCGFVSYMTTKFWLGGHCYKIDLKKSTFLEFFYQLLKANESRIMGLRVGSGLPNIQKGTLLSLKIPFVTNPGEQQKIASCLSSLDELITAHNDRLDALKDHKKSLLQNLFPQEGETVPKVRFPEFEGDGEWIESSIQNLLDNKIIISHLDGNHGALYPRADEFSEDGVPYLTANDLISGTVDFRYCKHLPLEKAKKFKKGVAKNGDVLFAHNATVGPVAKLITDLPFVILSTTVTYYRCDNESLINDFLRYALESPFFVAQYKRVMSQSTRNQVPITTQRKFHLQLPKPKEQQKIASCFSAVDELIIAQQDIIEQLQQQKKGLMQGLFPKFNIA